VFGSSTPPADRRRRSDERLCVVLSAAHLSDYQGPSVVANARVAQHDSPLEPEEVDGRLNFHCQNAREPEAKTRRTTSVPAEQGRHPTWAGPAAERGSTRSRMAASRPCDEQEPGDGQEEAPEGRVPDAEPAG